MPDPCNGKQIADDCQDNIDANDDYEQELQAYVRTHLNERMLTDSVGYGVYPGGVVAEAVQEDHDDIDRLFSNALRAMLMGAPASEIDAVAQMLGCEVIRVAKQHLDKMATHDLLQEAEDMQRKERIM
ncbi:MAG: hypothetical protein OQK82_01035 [Candidatus Pacearchaeota archaeon]|nr:hypothetical protein [Candidatus Pacearchaeota archaeon]